MKRINNKMKLEFELSQGFSIIFIENFYSLFEFYMNIRKIFLPLIFHNSKYFIL